jgi:TonB family protein
LIHIARRDWLCTVFEEIVRAVLWFHPAIWWLICEIHLTREQVVDRAVVAATGASSRYIDALLSFANRRPPLGVAAASFLRRRQLKRRVIAIVKEIDHPMPRQSRIRLVSTLGVAASLLSGAAWYATGAFPLEAQTPAAEPPSVFRITIPAWAASKAQIIGLPLHAGERATPARLDEFRAAIRALDPSLNVRVFDFGGNYVMLNVTPPHSNQGVQSSKPDGLGGTSVTTAFVFYEATAREQAARLISKVDPIYPHDALTARVSGRVRLDAMVDGEGRVYSLTLKTGNPLLVDAAVDAVRQWRYRPYMDKGQAQDVGTEIDIDFKLPRR